MSKFLRSNVILILPLIVLALFFQNCGKGLVAQPNDASLASTNSSSVLGPDPSPSPSPGPMTIPAPSPTPVVNLKNQWLSVTTSGAPTARNFHSAVWAGSKMIIWGGYVYAKSNAIPSIAFNDGGLYDPKTNSWTNMSVTGAPSSRGYRTSVWTGSKMIVFGGYDTPNRVGFNYYGVGAIYDPVGNQWSSMSTTGAPSARISHSAIWTGTQMIVFGGSTINSPSGVADGGVYDLATNSWKAISTQGAPSARRYHQAIWTGTKMIIWGGSGPQSSLANGAIYDPNTNTWTGMSSVGAPSIAYSAVWTGSKMIVLGDKSATYDPVTNTWKNISMLNAPAAFSNNSFWVGSKLISLSTTSESVGGLLFNPKISGGIYDVVLDAWSPLSAINSPQVNIGSGLGTAVSSGAEILIFGGNVYPTPGQPVQTNAGSILN